MSSRTARSDLSDEGATRTTRVGLSEYTTQRLAELRARRAELDADYNDYKSSKLRTDTATKPATSSSTAASSAASTTVSRSALLDSYQSRRSASSGTTNPSMQSTKADHSALDGKANGKSSPVRTQSYSPSEGGKESKIANGTVTSKISAPSKSAGLSTGSSFSKADYRSSRDGQLDEIKASVLLNRSNSARVIPTTEDDDECVGFASLPEQVHRKAVKRGFDFTLMAVGETGLGKSTLISSLFLNPELYKDRMLLEAKDRLHRTVEIERKYMEIEEKGVKLRLTIVDTPGFNDSMDAEQSWQPIEKYIVHQFEQYLKDESGLNRKNIKDYRVHCCLYFISPYGHGLRQIDIIFMKRLQDKVNIVPIIAKADTLTPTEVAQLKSKILDQIEEHNLQIYEFPDCDSDEDEDFKKQDAELKAAIPFAIIGSNTVIEVNGRKVRGRLYPWGVVEVDNPQHCDFSKLRMMLISTHMQDLKDVTRDVHYENFRARQIKEQMTKNQRERNNQPEASFKTDKENIEHDSKLKRDSSPNFESIMDQSQLLEQKEEEIRRMQEMIVKMQAQLQNSKKANGAVSNGSDNL